MVRLLTNSLAYLCFYLKSFIVQKTLKGIEWHKNVKPSNNIVKSIDLCKIR